MYQSNKQVKEAFIAAIHSLEKIPIYWNLKELRLQYRFLSKKNSINKKGCICDFDNDIITTIPNFFPIYSSNGATCRGEFNVLPFYYLIFMNNSKVYPIVELIEVPFLYDNSHLKKISKEKMEHMLNGFGIPHIVSQKEIHKENLKEEIYDIRKIVINKILKMTTLNATVCFSFFSNLFENILLEDTTGYMNALRIEDNRWSFQSNKFIPIKYKNILYTFTLRSLAMASHEV